MLMRTPCSRRSLHALAIDLVAGRAQLQRELAAAVERSLQVEARK
jgi:hypothetical protein